MNRKFGLLHSCMLMLVITACNKHSVTPALPDGSIAIEGLATADTIEMPMELVRDSVIIIGLRAASENGPAPQDIHVSFTVDTSKMAGYRAKYGDARVLPSAAYFFYKPDCRIQAGSKISDSAKLNLVQQTRLRGFTTYVLPITILSANGRVAGVAPGQVLYLVIKTGKATFIPKDGWKIVNVSNENSFAPAVNLLDYDDLNTYWATSIGISMPQYVTIDFGEQLAFSGVTFCSSANYISYGYGYATEVQIELSADGTTWTAPQTFNAQAIGATQVISTGPTSARYLRFTVLAVQPASGLPLLVLTGIGLQP